MKIALDTNILAYIAGFERSSSDSAKVERARVTVEQLVRYNELIVVTQVLGELYNLLTKGGIARREARDIVGLAESKYLIVAGTRSCFQDAFDLATDHKLQFWDSLILSTAANAGCALLLSEDMQDGFTVRGMTIANPFLGTAQPALGRLLNG